MSADGQRRVLALSPHLDDAVFSCGGTLARLADLGWKSSVATLFTRSVPEPSGFALACQLDKGLPADIDYMALRRDEDRRACATIGVEAIWLDLAEAPHRGYGSAAALFGPVASGDGIERDVADALAALLDRVAPHLVLAPQAIGGHVDHVVAVRALRALAISTPTLWWRDFPYVARPATAAPFADLFAGLHDVACAIDPDRKGEACAAYASQLGFQFGGASALAAVLAAEGDRERFAHHAVTSLPEGFPAMSTVP